MLEMQLLEQELLELELLELELLEMELSELELLERLDPELLELELLGLQLLELLELELLELEWLEEPMPGRPHVVITLVIASRLEALGAVGCSHLDPWGRAGPAGRGRAGQGGTVEVSL